MKYVSILLFCIWVIAEMLSAQPAEKQAAKDPAAIAGQLVEAARFRTTQLVRYDPAYVSIDYPGGDVPADTGVCTDVVIRAYRALGIDLQKRVHEDMKRNFSAYPKL